MAFTIDLNADLGEGFAYDLEMLPLLSSVNLSCGAHAGSLADRSLVLEHAKQHQIRIGAHPGYPDPENFGRKVMQISLDELYQSLHDQVAQLMQLAGTTPIAYIKPHGALYNQANQDPQLAQLLIDLVKSFNNPELSLMLLAGGLNQQMAEQQQVKVIAEAFVDRRYTDQGLLVSRDNPQAMISDDQQAINQAMMIATQKQVISINDNRIKLNAQSLCIHGDHLHSLQFAKQIRMQFHNSGIVINNSI